VDALTPVQERTLDVLMGRGFDRPTFPRGLGERLRDRIVRGIGGVAFDGELWISKHKVNDHGRCEGLFIANLLGEGTPFEHRFQTAAGALLHKAVELDVPRGREDPSGILVDRAAESLAARDGAFAGFWDGLDAIARSEVCAEAIRQLEQFRAMFPPLKLEWTPVVEWGIRQEFGPVIFSGRVDLLLGGQDAEEPMRARRIAFDLKTGRAREEFPEDMRLYALLLTLYHGVPPFRVASVFLESGEWQAEDVDERSLDHAADRFAAAVRAASELLSGSDPRLTPGPWCRWCPRAETCPVALRDDAPAELPAAER
jgi:hypothetical protein